MGRIAKVKLGRQSRRGRVNAAGFTMVELLLVLVVGMIITAMALPTFTGAIATYELNGAVECGSFRCDGVSHAVPDPSFHFSERRHLLFRG